MFHAKVADQSLASVQLRFQSLLSLPRPAWNPGTDGMRKRSRQPSDSSVVFLLVTSCPYFSLLDHAVARFRRERRSVCTTLLLLGASIGLGRTTSSPSWRSGNEIDALLLEAGSKGMPTVPAGLRYILVRDAKDVRDSIARALYAKGLLADGNVVLTFRPDWADTDGIPTYPDGD